MSIRSIEPRDKATIIGLARQMHAESPAYRDYPFQSLKLGQWVDLCLEDPNWMCILAQKNDVPIGFMAFGIVEMIFCSHKTVDDLALYIDPEHRGGIAGAAMVNRCIRWAKARQAREIRLGVTTEIDNSRVAQFLERLGFSQTGQLMTLKL